MTFWHRGSYRTRSKRAGHRVHHVERDPFAEMTEPHVSEEEPVLGMLDRQQQDLTVSECCGTLTRSVREYGK
jgi:hypothetical protein